jgi:multidrug resistance protein EbrB
MNGEKCMKHYIALGMSIIGEVFATTMLKASEGFTILLPSVGVIIGYTLSFYFISISLQKIPLSLAYAVWSGLGTALTALIGVILWGELFNTLILLGIILIVGGVIVMNLSNSTKVENE